MHAAASKTHMCRLTWAHACIFSVCVCVVDSHDLRQVCEGCLPCSGGRHGLHLAGQRWKACVPLMTSCGNVGGGGGTRYSLSATLRSLRISIDICRAAVYLSWRDGLIYNLATSNQQTPCCRKVTPPKAGGLDAAFTARHLLLTVTFYKEENKQNDWGRLVATSPEVPKSDNFHDLAHSSSFSQELFLSPYN